MSIWSKLFGPMEPEPVRLHKAATQAVDKWFWSFWKPTSYYKRIPIKCCVHLCGSEAELRQRFKVVHGHFPATEGIGGLYSIDASGDSHIWLVSDHRPNQWGLGHEIVHLLRHFDESISNPDEATHREYYK